MRPGAQQYLPAGYRRVLVDGIDQRQPSVLPGYLVPFEFGQGQSQAVFQLGLYLHSLGRGGAQHCVATQLVSKAAALVSVHPTEQTGKLLGGGAGGEAMRPVLREAVVFGGGLEAAAAHGELHAHIGPR